MSNQIKHIFIFVFVLSVFSLTLQSSVINLCKESKAFKSQSSPLTEEEEEKQDVDEEADEMIYTGNELSFINSGLLISDVIPHLESHYFSYTQSIPIPPPKF